MQNPYAQWMYAWEDRLCSVSTNRVVRPFDWGLDWLPRAGLPPIGHGSNGAAGTDGGQAGARQPVEAPVEGTHDADRAGMDATLPGVKEGTDYHE